MGKVTRYWRKFYDFHNLYVYANITAIKSMVCSMHGRNNRYTFQLGNMKE